MDAPFTGPRRSRFPREPTTGEHRCDLTGCLAAVLQLTVPVLAGLALAGSVPAVVDGRRREALARAALAR